LGDSLARGAQPNAAGATVPTNQGYADFLYATEKSKVKGLKLIKLGCLGESTTTIINGGICSYTRGSQLRTALKFISTHKIALITLDIGANDVDFCAKGNAVNLPCITKGVGTITTNVPKIVRALRAAAGPAVEIAGMTYYDPFLAVRRRRRRTTCSSHLGCVTTAPLARVPARLVASPGPTAFSPGGCPGSSIPRPTSVMGR
jgi:lysophospholipase L1-like esterase